MKALCIADIHGYQEGVILTRDYVVDNDIDYVFVLGDYSVGFKDPRQNLIDAEYTLGVLKRDAKVYALPGNCDQIRVVDIFKKHGSNFHERVVEIGGFSFIGLGGSNPTPFNTPFELNEDEIYNKLNDLIGKSRGRVVLITHFPPKDTKCDAIPDGVHVGSTSLRKIIEEKKPEIVLCSHIHESGGIEDTLGNTKIINVGLLSSGRAVLVEADGDISVKPINMMDEERKLDDAY